MFVKSQMVTAVMQVTIPTATIQSAYPRALRRQGLVVQWMRESPVEDSLNQYLDIEFSVLESQAPRGPA